MLFILSLIIMANSGGPTPYQATENADLVVVNAHVYTMNDAQRRAEAFAVHDGRFIFVGTSEETTARFPNAPRVDAGARTIIPGLIDAHAHLMGLGMSRLQADLTGARSKEEVIERLRIFERNLPDDAWLTGRGWDQNDWPETQFPTRADLDDAFPDRPVWLVRVDGHAAWSNTAALEHVDAARIRESADPHGGRIVRGEDGRPTGIFIDAAMELVARHIPALSLEERQRALRLALEETAQYGLTGVHDAGVSLDDIQLFQDAIDEDRFDLRLYAMIGGEGSTFDHFCANGPINDYGGRLTVRSVKYFIDGALGSRGAALLDDYADDPHNRGLLMYEPEAYRREVGRAFECGFQVNTHAIGDRGARLVLDTYEQLMRQTPAHAGRHRIEHAQVVSLDDIRRFRELSVIASMQPIHATSDMYWAEARLGSDRIHGAYAWRHFLNGGVRVAFGSDFPVEPANPLLGFYAAVTRQDVSGWPVGGWYADQRVTREEALRGFTLDAAYAAFQEDDLGSIEPGKYADFVVLDRDILTVEADQILETSVVATYLGGKAIFEKPQ
ncbi:MAG: amidohydrolase [Bacteroidota bacterium]